MEAAYDLGEGKFALERRTQHCKERWRRTMWTGRLNVLIASLTTLTIPACEHLR